MIIEKLRKVFPEERLMIKISAVQDEKPMRRCIEKVLTMHPIKGKKFALDIGCYHGLSSALLAEYFDEVHTIDIAKDRGGYYQDQKIKYEVWDYLDVSHKIKFHLIKDNSEKDDLLKTIPYNFAFVDGRHKGKGGVIDDYELTKGCGRILFHDYMPHKAKGNNLHGYVVNFIDSINPDYVEPPFAIKVIK